MSAVANGRLLENVTELIDLQRQRVLNARFGWIALVAIAQRLFRVGEENCVVVGASRLHGADGEVLRGNGIGRTGALDLYGRSAGMVCVVSIDLLAQHGALEGSTGFALLVD